MNAKANSLSWSLLESVRDIGTERGVDLVLNVLFARWMTLQQDGRKEWAAFVGATTDEELGARFARLAIFPDDQPLEASETVSYLAVLRKVAQLVNDSINTDDVSSNSERSVVAAVFDETLGHLSRLGKQSGESDTPRALAELMVALTVQPGDSVLDPVCGNGTDLVLAAQAHPNVIVSGFDNNRRVARRASMRLMINGANSMSGMGAWRGDAFEEHAASEYDVVLAQPPWGVTFTEEQKERIRELADRCAGPLRAASFPKSDMPWLLLALDALRVHGRAAVLLSTASLSARCRDTHQHLLDRRAVEAIISLPSGLFVHTGVKTALWLLRATDQEGSPDSILMVDGSTLVEATEKGRFQITPNAQNFITVALEYYRASGALEAPEHVARVVPLDEIDLQRGLNPQTYLSDAPADGVAHPAPNQSLLTEIQLTNFKAFGRSTPIPLAPLTLVYGANSAGKSSVIQALLLLKQSRKATTLITQGPIVNVGAFQGIVHGHGDGPVEVSLSYGVLPTWIPLAGTPDPTLNRTVSWAFAANSTGQATPQRTVLRFGDYALTFTRDPDTSETHGLSLDDAAHVFRGVAGGTLLYPFDSRHRTDGDEAEQAKWLRGRENNARRALRVLESDGVNSLAVRSSGLLGTGEIVLPRAFASHDREQGIVASYVNRTARLAAGVSEEVDQLLDSLVWLGPLRSAPQRVYDRADTSSNPGDGRHIAIYLFDHTSVVEQVNDWLKRMEIPYSLDVIPVTAGKAANLIGDLVAISLTDSRSGINVTPADVGFGISQILPIVVELLARRDCIIAVEQPETHLHPRLQARLADLFIDATQEGGRGNQLIVETHSEHLMLRVQRRIREGTLDPSKVSVVYVDQDPTGQATVQPLRINEQGEFEDEWPHGFFDERLDELFGEL